MGRVTLGHTDRPAPGSHVHIEESGQAAESEGDEIMSDVPFLFPTVMKTRAWTVMAKAIAQNQSVKQENAVRMVNVFHPHNAVPAPPDVAAGSVSRNATRRSVRSVNRIPMVQQAASQSARTVTHATTTVVACGMVMANRVANPVPRRVIRTNVKHARVLRALVAKYAAVMHRSAVKTANV